jgi:pseudouridine-5'-phosphate glycosidase/pseudouridine kinase
MPDITSTASPPALPVSQPPPIAPTEPIVPVSSPLVIVGSLAIDLTLIPSSSSPLLTTTPGTVSLSLGGVASNIASASHSLGVSDVLLVSPVAGLEDLLSVVAKRGLEERGMRSDGLVVIEGEKTATCGILMDAEGELIGGVADMGIVELMDPKQASQTVA